MNLEMKNRRTMFLLMGIAMILTMIAVIVVGCSNKDGEDTEAADAGAVLAERDDDSVKYSSVEESIIESIREKYSFEGIEITSLELEVGQGDSARIGLDFPDHSRAQAALAGLRILRDNFPKTSKFVVKTGGEEYVCESREVAYICSKGYNLDCPEEESGGFLEIVRNGIPDEDADEPIRTEAL